MPPTITDYADINGARLYYQLTGRGTPLIMLHAGIADCRMWDDAFHHFSPRHQVLRYDMRGYGKSLPVPGQFNIQDDLQTILAHLNIAKPLILMGCSMGAGLAIEYALTHPKALHSLILVGGSPQGFEADVASPDALFAQSEQAFNQGDIDRVAEIDMRIWFDGCGRDSSHINTKARKRAYEMAHLVTRHELQRIGTHIRKPFDPPPSQRLAELTMPALIIIGDNDLPYLRAASDYLAANIPNAKLAPIPNAAHLPNMEHPKRFKAIVDDFLAQA